MTRNFANPGPMNRPDLADITVRNTTAGRSHGKLEPMPVKRNWWNYGFAFFTVLIWAVLFVLWWAAMP